MPFITQGKTNLKYILIVVVLAVIVGGGILGYYYSWMIEIEARLVELESRLLAIKPSEKTPEDETVNWKVYEDNELRYRISYPSNWTLETEWLPGCGRVFWAPGPGGIPGERGNTWMTICSAPGGNSLETVAQTLSAGSIVTFFEETLLDGHVAVRQRVKSTDPSNLHQEVIIIAKYDKTTGTAMDLAGAGAIAVFLYSDEESYNLARKDFEKMLSTFKFLE